MYNNKQIACIHRCGDNSHVGEKQDTIHSLLDLGFIVNGVQNADNYVGCG